MVKKSDWLLPFLLGLTAMISFELVLNHISKSSNRDNLFSISTDFFYVIIELGIFAISYLSGEKLVEINKKIELWGPILGLIMGYIFFLVLGVLLESIDRIFPPINYWTTTYDSSENPIRLLYLGITRFNGDMLYASFLILGGLIMGNTGLDGLEQVNNQRSLQFSVYYFLLFFFFIPIRTSIASFQYIYDFSHPVLIILNEMTVNFIYIGFLAIPAIIMVKFIGRQPFIDLFNNLHTVILFFVNLFIVRFLVSMLIHFMRIEYIFKPILSPFLYFFNSGVIILFFGDLEPIVFRIAEIGLICFRYSLLTISTFYIMIVPQVTNHDPELYPKE